MPLVPRRTTSPRCVTVDHGARRRARPTASRHDVGLVDDDTCGVDRDRVGHGDLRFRAAFMGRRFMGRRFEGRGNRDEQGHARRRCRRRRCRRGRRRRGDRSLGGRGRARDRRGRGSGRHRRRWRRIDRPRGIGRRRRRSGQHATVPSGWRCCLAAAGDDGDQHGEAQCPQPRGEPPASHDAPSRWLAAAARGRPPARGTHRPRGAGRQERGCCRSRRP